MLEKTWGSLHGMVASSLDSSGQHLRALQLQLQFPGLPGREIAKQRAQPAQVTVKISPTAWGSWSRNSSSISLRKILKKITVEAITSSLRTHHCGCFGSAVLSPVHVCTSCRMHALNSSKRRRILNPKSQRKYQEAPKYPEWSASLSQEAFGLQHHAGATPITSSYTVWGFGHQALTHTDRWRTHTHTLAQNCHCEFCCGMHLMCNTLPLYIYTWQEWVLTGMGRLRDLKTLRSYHCHSQRVAPTRTRKSNWLTQICWNSTGRLMVWPDAVFRNEERNWSEMETDPEQQVITTSSSMVETATEWKHGRQQNCQVRNE